MSIVFSGCKSRSGGIQKAITKQIKLVNLKPLTKITVRFDPFHDKTKDTRDFLFYMSSSKIAATNILCNLKTEILCDRSDPVIECDYESKEKLILKSANLTSLELLKIFNKHVSSKVEVTTDEIQQVPKKKGKISKKK